MKKNFVEPELVRIDLKMTENIATSQGERFFEIKRGTFSGFFATRQYVDECTTFVALTYLSLDYVDNTVLTLEQKKEIHNLCPSWLFELG